MRKPHFFGHGRLSEQAELGVFLCLKTLHACLPASGIWYASLYAIYQGVIQVCVYMRVCSQPD